MKTGECAQLFSPLNNMRYLVYRDTVTRRAAEMRGDRRTIKKERISGSVCGYAMPGKEACQAEILASAAAEGRPRCRYHAARLEYVPCTICPAGHVAANALVHMCSSCRQSNERAYRKALREYYAALAQTTLGLALSAAADKQACQVIEGQAPAAEVAEL